MRIETKEIKIYEFDELSEDVKEEVKEKIEQRIIDNRFEWLKEDLQEHLKHEYNINGAKLEYSFSYCQGDGCCFYGINLLSYFNLKKQDNLNKFESYILEKYSPEEIELILEYLHDDCNLKLIKHSSHYSHKCTCSIDYGWYYNDDKECENKVNNLIDKLAQDLEENVFYVICDELEEIGYNCYYVDEDEILEYIEINEYEFLEDGSIY